MFTYKKTCFSAKNELFEGPKNNTKNKDKLTKELLKLLYHGFGMARAALADLNTPFPHV